MQSIWCFHWTFKFSLNVFMPQAELANLSHFFLTIFFILLFKYLYIFKYLTNYYSLRTYLGPGNIQVSKKYTNEQQRYKITCSHWIFFIFYIISTTFCPLFRQMPSPEHTIHYSIVIILFNWKLEQLQIIWWSLSGDSNFLFIFDTTISQIWPLAWDFPGLDDFHWLH